MDWEIIFWVVVAALAFVGEVLSMSFFLVFFAIGAVVGVLAALLGLGTGAQVIGFIVASVASMVILRPKIVNRLSFAKSEGYESRAITGKSGVVTEPIEPDGSGTVRIGSGEFWTARSLYGNGKIEKGVKVRVLDTDGLTALVESVEIEETEGGRL